MKNPETLTVHFSLNYDTATQAPQPVSVENNKEMALALKPIPEREGYRFAGWYKDPACTQEWLFGAKTPQFMQPPVEWMSVKEDMTLYARWAAPVHIRTEEELNAMRKDLSGWYVLDNDIDLSALKEWEPVGKYEPDYEYADAEWWVHAFKGRLDGNGHAIKGLKISGEHPFFQCGLFGAIANGEVHNLVIDQPVIDVKGAILYAGTVAGMMRQDRGRHSILEGIRVKGLQTRVEIGNADTTYVCVAGLIAGIWDGDIKDCQVDGKLQVKAANQAGGMLFVGGLGGETYSNTDRCIANGSRAEGSIAISGDSGKGQVVVGGLAGSERYGVVSGNSSNTSIQASGTPIQAGSIIGEYNFQYAVFGMMQGITETVLKDNRGQGAFPIIGSGPVPFFEYNGLKMTYTVENCS